MDIVERWRERKRKRLLECRMLGIMREDMVDINGDHHSEENGRYISKNGGGSGPENKNSNTPRSETHIPVKKLKEIKANLERRLLGKKTTDGKVIRAVGDHLVLQCARREVYPSSIVNAVFYGRRKKAIEKHGRFAYVYLGTVVILTPEGNLMNVIYTGKK